MRRGTARRPLRAWFGAILLIVVAAPLLAGGGTYAALTWWQRQAEQSHLTAARQFVGDPARWNDPRWQAAARQRLAALGVGAQLLAANGQTLLATTASLPPGQWTAAAGDGEKDAIPSSGATRGPRGIAILFYVFPLPAHTRLAVALGGGLLALLLALAGAAWFLRRAVMRPLLAMSAAARKIEDGRLDVHVPLSPICEMADVAVALETMSAGLRDAARRQEEMEQERRLFIGAIAHDLRTPLFTLRAFLSGLKDGLAATPEKSARYVEVCQEKADALEHLIADLFAYSRLEYLEQAPRQEPLELGALLRQAVDGVQPLAAAGGVVVTLDGCNDPDMVVGDEHLLARAVQNLLDNALRHTPSGGHVRVYWRQEGSRLVFCVADTGPGIAAHDLPHLFTPLYRGETSRNRQTGGAGLGLTIARRILLAHGGDITATNAPTGGAVFTGTLPAARPTQTPIDHVTMA